MRSKVLKTVVLLVVIALMVAWGIHFYGALPNLSAFKVLIAGVMTLASTLLSLVLIAAVIAPIIAIVDTWKPPNKK